MANISKIQIESGVYDIKDATASHILDTLSDLKSSTSLSNGEIIKTLGYYTKGDKGGANYKIRNKESGETGNDKDLIELTNSSLIAEFIPDIEINVIQFGAKGDDQTDNYNIFNSLFTYAKTNSIFNIYVPEGTYLLSNQLNMFSNLNLYGDGEVSILKAYNFANNNSYKSMIVLEQMPMNDSGYNVKNISIKKLKLVNNGIADAGKDGVIQFRGVRKANIQDININVSGANCWGIILFSANHNVTIDSINIDNTSADNLLGGCLWIRNGLYHVGDDTKTKSVYVTNSTFTSTAKDECVCLADGIDGGWTEASFNNITIIGKAVTTLPNFLLVINTTTANGYVKGDFSNINISGNCGNYAVYCKDINNTYAHLEVTNTNYNIDMTKGGGIQGGYNSFYLFSNCNINITENKRACYGIMLSDSYANSTCEASYVKNCVIDSAGRNCCEDCRSVENSVLRTTNKAYHSYGGVTKIMIMNNEIYADVNAIHCQNSGSTGASNCTFIGNYMQRLNNTSNTGSVAINVPYIANSRSLANRYLLKTGSTSGDSYGYNYYETASNVTSYSRDDNGTNV